MGNKDTIIRARISREDLRALKSRCRELGCSVSSYVRDAAIAYMIVDRANGEPPDVVLGDAYTLDLMRRELWRQGININQCATALNTIAKILREGDGAGFSDETRRAILGFVDDCMATLPGLGHQVEETRLSVVAMKDNLIVEMPHERASSALARSDDEAVADGS